MRKDKSLTPKEASTLSDEDLMRLYAEGQMEAFQALYSRHSAKVYGYLKGRLKHRDQADDLFQAVFLKLHNTRSKYDPTLPFVPWLFTISQSVLMDFYRASGRQQDLQNALQEMAQNENDPSSSLASVISLQIEGLPDKQKEALKLRYEEDYSFDEIAKRLNTTSGNVRQIVSRALRSLKVIGSSTNDK